MIKTIKELLADVEKEIEQISKIKNHPNKEEQKRFAFGKSKGILDATASFRAMLDKQKIFGGKLYEELKAQLPDEVEDEI